ncbi:MAG: Rieske (2Fe-2S) protein [Mycobacterium sp.]|nr:Rieske (2Fe-2S) protein [Mycobacterium sp.]
MSRRELRDYIDDLLAERQPRPFTADEFEAAQIHTAIELAAAREGAGDPRPEFLDQLKVRLAEEMSDSPPANATASTPNRRQVIVGATAAATVAVAAFSVDRVLSAAHAPGPEAVAGDEVVPTDGSWQRVLDAAELDEGEVRAFDLGSVSGFVRRVNGRVEAVSGACTHQGCRLWWDQAAVRLRCPCHSTSFSPAGEVLTHALPIAPKPLPHFGVREHEGAVEVLAPVGRST